MKYTMGQLAEIIDGDRGPNYPKQNEFFEEGYCLFLNTGNVTQEGFSFETNQFITEEKDKALRKGRLQRGDIVYTTRGTVGNAAFYSESVPYDRVRINSGMVILRCNDSIVDARFLYQLLKSNDYRAFFKMYCTGSAQPQLPIKNLSSITLDVPELTRQKRIADVISAHDDLIENNRKQIKLLEEAAQRLYKEWFIDLRFPGHETTPIHDGMPEGWEINRAESFFDISIGKTPPRAEKQWFVDGRTGIPWVSISDMGNSGTFVFGTAEGLTQEAVEKHNVRVVPQGTIFLSFKLTVGRVAIATTDMCTNEAIAHFRVNDLHRSYAYMYLKSFEYDKLGNTSAISKAVNSKIIKAMPFIMPDKDTLESFSRVVNPYLSEIYAKQFQNQLLTEARDRLLPKLISGEIEV